MSLEIVAVPVLKDNYIWLAHDGPTGATAVIDPAVADPPLEEAKRRGWRISHILNTHHHGDHVGGNMAIKAATGCQIIGAKSDKSRIPGIDLALGEGDTCSLGSCEAAIFDCPGHTSGHIAFWFRTSDALFCGDTLFALGCGRLFEGSAQQMWSSLSKFRSLPRETRVYCAHEYTQSNARFAVTVEPANGALARRAEEIDQMRAAGKMTVPSTIGLELDTNPFMRADNAALRSAIGMADAGIADWQVFAEVRQRKDKF